LRLLLAEIKNEEIKKGEQLSDPDMVSMVQREVKKRREAAEGFRSGGREESAKVEEQELEVLQAYLPEQLSNEELTKMVEEAINELGANSISDMGKVIGLVMGKVAGKAEGGAVSSIVKQKLNG
jgi:uncharacterized protein